MNVTGAVVVVTGGASGIGAALCRRFAADGARAVIVVDRTADATAALAAEIGGVAEVVDVTDAQAVADLVERVERDHGAIDLFCANAGILTGIGIEDDPDDLWHRAFEVNVMAHVYAARAIVPRMIERGGGYLVTTASAAGLLTAPGDAPYSVSKHGAVALAEWLSVTYGDRGLKVSVVCPLGVATPMLLDPLADGEFGAQAVAASGRVVSADEVADAVVAGIADERFLILPHPEVSTFWAQKASDPGRWLAGVRRLLSNTGAGRSNEREA